MVNCGQCENLMVRAGSSSVDPTPEYRVAGAAISGPNGMPLCLVGAHALAEEAESRRGTLQERIVAVLWRDRDCYAFRPVD